MTKSNLVLSGQHSVLHAPYQLFDLVTGNGLHCRLVMAKVALHQAWVAACV